MTKEVAVELITKAFPRPEQIADWDFSRDGIVCFTWRKVNRFRLSLQSLSVEESRQDDNTVKSEDRVKDSGIAILAEELVYRAWQSMRHVMS